MLIITVDNRIRIPVAGMPAEVLEALQRKFTYPNPDFARALRMQRRFRLPPKAIPTWKREGTELTLPRGGMQRVREALREAGIAYEAIDARTEGTGPRAALALDVSIEPYDFQREIVRVALERENVLVRAPTGSGKTTAAFLLACEVALPTLVVVHTTKLFDQWVRRLGSELGMRPSSIGMIRGSKRRVGVVTVAMQQTLSRCVREFEGVFGCVICDEAQRFAAKTFLAVVDRLSARYRVGISADERRKDRKEFLLYDVFGPVAYEVKRDELIDRGVVLDVEVRMVPTTFEAPWYRELREAEQRVHAARAAEEEPEPEDVAKVADELQEAFGRLLAEMAVHDERNAIAVRLALQAADEGEQVLVFSHRREHCHRLLADIAARNPYVGLLLGGDADSAEYDRTLAGVVDGTKRIAVGTYQAIGTGVDLPLVGRGVATTPIHMNRPFYGQVRGRLCRAPKGSTKVDAVLFYLWDECVFGAVPLRNMLRWNRVVKVWRDGAWRDGREVLKEIEDEAKRGGDEGSGTGGGAQSIEEFLGGGADDAGDGRSIFRDRGLPASVRGGEGADGRRARARARGGSRAR